MTKSVGIIGNRFSSGACTGAWQGYAPDATVLVANGCSYRDALCWARAQGVSMSRLSWHHPSEETSGAAPQPRRLLRLLGDSLAIPQRLHFGQERGRLERVRVRQGLQLHQGRERTQRRRRRPPLQRRHVVRQLVQEPHEPALRSWGPGGGRAGQPARPSRLELRWHELRHAGHSRHRRPADDRNASLKMRPEAIRAIMLATANYQDADGDDFSRYRTETTAQGSSMRTTGWRRRPAAKRSGGAVPGRTTTD